MSDFQDQAELHRVYREARIHRSSYFEKLALLDGGTVALVVTAVLGPLHGTMKHRYLLAVGLTTLVAAMIALLRRNLIAVQVEFHAAAEQAGQSNSTVTRQAEKINKTIHYSETLGVVLSGLGIVLLLIEVLLILI